MARELPEGHPQGPGDPWAVQAAAHASQQRVAKLPPPCWSLRGTPPTSVLPFTAMKNRDTANRTANTLLAILRFLVEEQG